MADIDYNCLQGDVYTRFIEEAVERSDSISFSVSIIDDDFSFAEKEIFLNVGFVENEYDRIHNEKHSEYLKNKNAFKNETLPFIEKFSDFIIKSSKGRTATTYFLRSEPEIIPILTEPKSISQWGFPHYPDDLCFISENRYWFISESHESSALLYPKDNQDYDFWCEQGIVFQETFD